MKPYAFAVGGAVVGIIIGYAVAAGMSTHTPHQEDHAEMRGTEDHMAAHDMKMSDGEMTAHTHTMLEVDSELPAPSVSLEAFPDTKDGYNLRITTENFAFTPESAGADATQGEGHAHLYVNGTKVARLYGEWYHLSAAELRDGENEVEVTLNADDHSEWVLDGEHIAASLTLRK